LLNVKGYKKRSNSALSEGTEELKYILNKLNNNTTRVSAKRMNELFLKRNQQG
jgi:hypothetical protein